MDFLDPIKEKRNRIALLVGYGLIALAIGIASLVLLYASYGYTVNPKGDVTQRGLVFVSSTPTGAQLTVDGVNKGQTNTRLDIGAGTYNVKVSAAGYRDWHKNITINGGDVQRFDYPFLVPTTLKTTTVATYAQQPLFVSQSPNKRLVLLAEAATPEQFTLLNIRDPKKTETSIVALPAALYTPGNGSQRWEPLEWSDDNKNVLFAHSYQQDGQDRKEYVVIDVTKPEASRNVTKTLSLDQAEVVSLFDKKADQYYGYNPATKILRSFTIESNENKLALTDVVAYKTYADDTILYVTTRPPSGKQTTTQVNVVLQQGARTTTLRRYTPVDQTYLLDIARYDGDWYVVTGGSADKGVYVYKNPQSQVLAANKLPSAWRYLKIDKPTYVAFSDNAQFIMAQGGQHIGVYDAENIVSRLYTLSKPVDAAMPHVSWMDGHRLMYVSSGKMYINDFDNSNLQELVAATPSVKPMFSGDYQQLYTINTATTGQSSLQVTPLRVTTP